MTRLKLVEYLGADVETLLKQPPFVQWECSREVDEDSDEVEIRYEFDGHDVEVLCDEDDRIKTIFLRGRDGQALINVSFSLTRRQVIQQFGRPSESGEATRLPGLGDYGAWDRFTLPTASLHVQYRVDRDEIDMVTLMHPDAVP